VRRHDLTGAVGVCRCEPPLCPDIPLTNAEITPLRLNWNRLTQALCEALTIQGAFEEMSAPSTVRVGLWSSEAVPVVLTIQTHYEDLERVIGELGVGLRKPFILLSPTSNLLKAAGRELLVRARAGFAPLDLMVTLARGGGLAPTSTAEALLMNGTKIPTSQGG
jgi:hypothetical protein